MMMWPISYALLEKKVKKNFLTSFFKAQQLLDSMVGKMAFLNYVVCIQLTINQLDPLAHVKANITVSVT